MSNLNYICPNCQFTGLACGAVIFDHQCRIEIQCANCHKKYSIDCVQKGLRRRSKKIAYGKDGNSD